MSFFMIFSIRKLIAITVLISSSLVLSSVPVTTLQAADGSHQDDTNGIRNLLHQFHHEIEGVEDSEKSKLQNLLSQWADNFNLVRISMDTHRFAQMKYFQDGGKTEYIKNLPVLASFYFLSHTMEVLSGPLGVYIASDLGLESSAKVMIGTVGAIISIPGLDPLCLLLFAVSPLNPVQKMMTGIRFVAVKVSGKISDRFHLQEIAQRILESKDRLAEIVNHQKGNNIRFVYDLDKDNLQRQMIVTSKVDQRPYLKLNFETDRRTKRTWVDSLEILDLEAFHQNKKEVDNILKQFNLSARYALKEALKNPRKTFYMEVLDKSDPTTNTIKIQFKEYAALIKPVLRVNSAPQSETLSCKSLFQ